MTGSVSSRIVLCCSVARLMILSSTSVRFMTWSTPHPRSLRTRRKRSSNRNVRKFPKCAGLYTVGPQVYMRTVRPSAGANGSVSRESELKRRKSGTGESYRLGENNSNGSEGNYRDEQG